MEKNTHKISPVAAGITGLVLGIVGTAAVALSDKQTRTKMTKKANEVKDNLEKWSKDTLHDLHAASSDMQQKAADKVDELYTEDSSDDSARKKTHEDLGEVK